MTTEEVRAPDAGPARPGWWATTASLEERRELLQQLQCVEVHLQTAASLDSRADRCDNDVLAAVLRDRAHHHRRTAERMRADLARRGVVSCRPARRP